MARGWESKSVESQIEDRNASAHSERSQSRANSEIEQARRVEDMEMSRRRVVRELETSHSPVHRTALENALKHLDAELGKLRK